MGRLCVCMTVCLLLAAGWASAQPEGTRLDFAPPDGFWDTTFDGTAWDPPITKMPPVGTLVDGTGDDNADADLIDRNNNGVSDAVAAIDTDEVLMELEEPVIPVGPRMGTTLDYEGDGVPEHTYDGAAWNPPIAQQPPVGTMVDLEGDGPPEARFADLNGNGVADAVVDIGTGKVLMELEEPVIPVGPRMGTTLDYEGDGVSEHTYDGAAWNPPIAQQPPVGTMVDLEGDGPPEARFADLNGNGVADAVVDIETGDVLMELEER